MYLQFLYFYQVLMNGDEEPPISMGTYIIFFKFNMKYAIGRPSLDICNFCYECKINNDLENNDYINHINEVKNY